MWLTRQNLHLGLLFAVVVAGGYLVAPLIETSLKTDHWAILVLSAFSILMIASEKTDCTPSGRNWLLWCAGLAFLLHLTLDIQKLAYLAGTLLLLFAYALCFQVLAKKLIWVVACGVLVLPVPYGVEQSIGVWLATAEAEMFVTFAQFFDVPIYRYGSQVVSGDVAVTINTNCSGTLLFVPAFLGCLVCAALRDISTGKKIAIIACALPLAISVNLLRLLVLLLLNFHAPETLVTAFHDFLGWFIMPVVWVLPIVLFLPFDRLVLPEIQVASKHSTVSVAALGLVFSGYAVFHNESETSVGEFAEVPVYVGGWVGEETSISQEERKIINADFLSRKTYYAPSGERQLVLTAIFHKDSNLSQQHSSSVCFKALGWLVSHVEFQQVDAGVRVEHLMVRSHSQVQAVAEIVSDIPGREGRLRLQIVENPDIPIAARKATTVQFLQQIQTRLGKQL